MRSNRIGNVIFAAAVCAAFGVVGVVRGDPGNKPHNEQGRVLRRVPPIFMHPSDPRHPQHRLWAKRQTWNIPGWFEGPAPEDPIDAPPADPDPCPNC